VIHEEVADGAGAGMSEKPKPRKPRLLSLVMLLVGIAALAFGYYGNSFFAKWFGVIVPGVVGFIWIGVSIILLGIGQLLWPVLPLDSPKSGPATLATVWRMLPLFWKVWVVLSVITGGAAMVAGIIWLQSPR
jgi:hypothetical protein